VEAKLISTLAAVIGLRFAEPPLKDVVQTTKPATRRDLSFIWNPLTYRRNKGIKSGASSQGSALVPAFADHVPSPAGSRANRELGASDAHDPS
jgi:hypothetical protein